MIKNSSLIFSFFFFVLFCLSFAERNRQLWWADEDDAIASEKEHFEGALCL